MIFIWISFRPFKIVGGPDGKPVVEVESGGKAAKYVCAYLVPARYEAHLSPT